MTQNNRVAAVVPAAGVGRRMQSSQPKQYLQLGGVTVLEHTIMALSQDPRIEHIFIATSTDDPYFTQLTFKTTTPVTQVNGGATRAASVERGVAAAVHAGFTWVAVHDAARPCLTAPELKQVLDQALADEVGALLALPVGDTLKREGADQTVLSTVDRSQLWQAQTPQVFRSEALLSGLLQLGVDNPQLTDEASVLEALGKRPKLVQGQRSNIKITLPGDEKLAELWLTAKK